MGRIRFFQHQVDLLNVQRVLVRVTPWLALPGLQDQRAVVVDVLQGDKELSNPNQQALQILVVFQVEPNGLSGGLALLWKREVSVVVKFADKNVVDCAILYGGYSLCVSFVYGEPSQIGKDKVWE
ncbi:unnamed protein product [Brassica napus]|uniref:(rape) hypothetical protein n=1 Tax=Brassica napus TaxID=3708 RepID=A0A816Q1S0_BRANA|nr:unnamed protein product [Brassica napus]